MHADSIKIEYVCSVCAAPVSIDGRARNGELLHECPKHGWVAPVAREENYER